MRGISFNRLAKGEIDEAFYYYEEQSPGLGEAFLDEIERALVFIQRHPEAATRVDDSPRHRLVLTRFPYYLLYRPLPRGEIRILAVGHQKRHPRYWKGRT